MNLLDAIPRVLGEIWILTGEMSPYLMLGFLMAGILRVVLREELVVEHMGSKGFLQTLKATLIGVPMPLCSCGVIPVAASLRRSGAGKGATTAFLSSTPQTGIDSIMATYGLLGPAFAALRVVVSFLSGIITGVLVDRFDPDDEKTRPEPLVPMDQDMRRNRIRTLFTYGFVSLPQDIGRALLLGLLIAGILGAVIPASFFTDRFDGVVLEMLMMTAIAIPLYVCSTGSIPIAVAFLRAGISPGAALVFLIAGPATNAATVTTLWKLMGRKTVAIYLVSIVGFAWLAGLSLRYLPLNLDSSVMAHSHVSHITWWHHVSAALLLLILVNALLAKSIVSRRRSRTEPVESRTSYTVGIEGMRCTQCANSVSRSLLSCPGVIDTQVDFQKGTAVLSGSAIDAERVRREVEALGYTFTGISKDRD